MNNQNLSHQLQQFHVNILYQKILVSSVQELVDICENSAEDNPFLEFEKTYSDDFSHSGATFEKLHQARETLFDNLKKQLAYNVVDSSIYETAVFITDLLDNNGYLKFSIEEICSLTKADKNTVEKALGIIKSLEPAGIGARNIVECLMLQMKARKMDDSPAFGVLSKHGDDLLSGRFTRIKKEMKLTDQDLSHIIEDIRKLSPFPGRLWAGSEQAIPIVPDVVVKDSEKGPLVEFAEDKMFKFFLNEKYLKLLKSSSVSAGEKAFLKEKLSQARKLLACIENRRRFLKEIINYIICYQEEFISGKGPLKKLMEKDLATRFNCSISLISRAISRKYVATCHGTFQLKKLFNYPSYKQSQDFVADMIEGIINNSQKPLSDRQISQKLKEIGIQIAPRTVNKYRHKREIVNSYLRRLGNMLEKKL